MTQSVSATWNGLVTICGTLFANSVAPTGQPVLVSAGEPGTYQPDAIVAVMDARVPETRPTMSTNRSREKATEIDVLFSVFVPGDIQTTANDACWVLVDAFEAYFRIRGNETVFGGCRDAWVSDTAFTSNIARDENGSATGRLAEATCTVSAAIRI